MSRETLIHLELEREGDCFFVSSPEFPLLQLSVSDEDDLESRVLPVLQRMVEDQTGRPVRLRLIPPFALDQLTAQPWRERHGRLVPPHVIAEAA